MTIEKLLHDIELMEDDGWAEPCRVFRALLKEHKAEHDQADMAVWSDYHDEAQKLIRDYGKVIEGKAQKGSFFACDTAREPKSRWRPCPNCEGEGRVADVEGDYPWSVWEQVKAAGNLPKELEGARPVPCRRCRGTGRIEREEVKP